MHKYSKTQLRWIFRRKAKRGKTARYVEQTGLGSSTVATILFLSYCDLTDRIYIKVCVYVQLCTRDRHLAGRYVYSYMQAKHLRSTYIAIGEHSKIGRHET